MHLITCPLPWKGVPQRGGGCSLGDCKREQPPALRATPFQGRGLSHGSEYPPKRICGAFFSLSTPAASQKHLITCPLPLKGVPRRGGGCSLGDCKREQPPALCATPFQGRGLSHGSEYPPKRICGAFFSLSTPATSQKHLITCPLPWKGVPRRGGGCSLGDCKREQPPALCATPFQGRGLFRFSDTSR